MSDAGLAGTDGEVVLRDGRRLAFREYGLAGGEPLLYFHGWPGARLECAACDGAARAAGVRLIALDRPGMGRSSPRPRRRVLDWPDDVAELADSLALERFAVLGFSFGAPYARACAYALPQRVTRAIVVSGTGPPRDPAASVALMQRHLRLTLTCARRFAPLALPLTWLAARDARADAIAIPVEGSVPASDTAALARPEVSACLHAAARECFRAGLRGAAADVVAVARADGFALEDIRAPVELWHGELDVGEPVAMARSQERRIPGARARYVADGGHLILFEHCAAMLRGL